MDANEQFQHASARNGWTLETLFDLACRYIDRQEDPATLHDFLLEQEASERNTPMPDGPVTISDIAKVRLQRDAVSGADFAKAGLPMFGGCQVCHATIAAYNAYPSRSGFVRCKDCIVEVGFITVEAFETFVNALSS